MEGFFDSLNIIIFSKNRPAQLDLFLRSMKCFFPDYSKYKDIHVLYTYSNNVFKIGYTKTISLHPEIHYVAETLGKFKENVLNLIDEDRSLTMFFVDDIVFKSHFTLYCKEVEKYAMIEDIACVSLRLCPRICYSYTMDVPITVPQFIGNDLYIWNWQEADIGYWSYPMSLDGHLFRTERILPLIKFLDYQNPNTMEGSLASNPFNLPYMICFDDSKIINIPANKVQDANNNRHGNISAEYINERFLNGYKLSLETILSNPLIKSNNASHQDIPLEWEKEI
jgi:hypothetical protein